MEKEDKKHITDSFLPEDAEDFFIRLRDDVPWTTMEWRKGVNLPRLIYKSTPEDSNPKVINELVQIFEDTFETKVHGIFANYYKTQSDYCPFHQDSYGNHVTTFSFGGDRRFVTRSKSTKQTTQYILKGGDIFYFSPRFNEENEHSIPKTTKYVDPRISVVFFTDEPFSQTHWIKEPYPEFAIKDEGSSSQMHWDDDLESEFTIKGEGSSSQMHWVDDLESEFTIKDNVLFWKTEGGTYMLMLPGSDPNASLPGSYTPFT